MDLLRHPGGCREKERVGALGALRSWINGDRRHFRFTLTGVMAKENLCATWEYKYRVEIASQKLLHYDSAECMIADCFREITLEKVLGMNLPLTAIEYWMRLRRTHGLPMIC